MMTVQSQAIEISEDHNVQIEDSEAVTKIRSKKGKRHIKSVYEDQCFNGDVMQIDSIVGIMFMKKCRYFYLNRCKHTEIKSQCSNRCL